MKTEHDDTLMKALALLQKAMPGEDRALRGSSLSPASDDVCELFLVELQARRERLKHWIRLVSEGARLNGGRAPVVCGTRHKCRGTGLPPRAERRPIASQHSTAA